MWTGAESLRHVGTLIRALPPESSLVTSLPPADRGTAPRVPRWSYTDWILADVFDVLAAANWQRVGDNRAKKPKPYPRPTDPRPSLSSGLTDEQLATLRARGPRKEDPRV